MKNCCLNYEHKVKGKIIYSVSLLSTALLSLFILSGCECSHEWSEATCTQPQICEKCGETQGEALGHSWIEATCTEAKHCEICDKVEGEPLEHTPGEWVVITPATCTEPGKQQSTCSVCGETITEAIEPLGHQLGEWEIGTQASAYSSGEKIQKCTVCGEIINRDTYYLTPEEVAAAEQALQTAIEIGDISASKTILNSIPIATTDVSNLPNSIAVYYQITNPTNYKIDRIGVRVTLLDSDGKPLTSGTDYISGILPQQFTEGLTSVRCSSPISTVNIEPIYVEFENGAYFSIE